MIFSLFRKSTAPHAASEAYRSIVAQSRQERFYADWGVPDTVTGRFDMISLHLTLLLHRLRREPAGKQFTQALVDTFFQDMDRSHRELGVTDLGVPRKIKKLGNAFYGMAQSLSDALETESPTQVEAVLVRNVYVGAPSAGAAPLAAYLLSEVRRLAAEPTAALVAGNLATGVAA